MVASKKYIILTSGIGLGAYVPALLIERQLSLSYETHFFVIENLFSVNKKDKILLNKQAFHHSLRVALKAMQFSSNITSSINQNSLSSLFSEWDLHENASFVLFSGFWLPVIEKYLSLKSNRIKNIYLCHMDAVLAPSWQNYNIDNPIYNNIWLFNWDNGSVKYSIQNIAGVNIIPFKERSQKLLIHGGGWGIGTYKDKIEPLTNNGFSLDIIAYEKQDVDDFDKKRYFMIDPEWKSWEVADNNTYIFPPFGEVKSCEEINYSSNYLYPDVIDHISKSLAIISKPGGGTIIDSLLTATPLIYLEGYGNHEIKNALLWNALGAGISYEEWKDEHFNIKILEKIHNKLLNLRKQTKDIVQELTRD